MIDADSFLRPARERGFRFFTGVPCSFLTPLINGAIGDPRITYVGATNEGEAVAIAAGAWLAGRRSVVMIQNSGLGNAVNPFTSLNHPFRIPTLLVATWRGQPGLADEPQHELMGRVTPSLLDLLSIPNRPFPTEETEVEPALDAASAEMERTGLPYAFVMEKGAVREVCLEEPEPATRPPGDFEDLRDGGPRPSRVEALERFLGIVPEDAAVIATTGKCGRELFTLADRPQHLYQVGSMGCASAIGLGVALNNPCPVVVLDGDGAALMRLGTLATIGALAPSNLVHVLLDNGVHDSTGGQHTVSASVDFARAALACGYTRAASSDGLAGFESALRRAFAGPGPSFLHLRIRPGSLSNLGRPTVRPDAVARRFRAFLGGEAAGRRTAATR